MKIDILKVAKLANLKLKDNEENELEGQLTSILGYIEKLMELNRASAGSVASELGQHETVLRRWMKHLRIQATGTSRPPHARERRALDRHGAVRSVTGPRASAKGIVEITMLKASNQINRLKM